MFEAHFYIKYTILNWIFECVPIIYAIQLL